MRPFCRSPAGCGLAQPGFQPGSRESADAREKNLPGAVKGRIDHLALSTSDRRVTETAKIATSKGARTALFVPELDRLFVAVRAEASHPAEIWVFAPH